jgi:hypothetical protein
MVPNQSAALATAARRLRSLRRQPNPFSYQSHNEQVCLGMSYAYEYALRVLIDEFGADDRFHELFYGPQSESNELDASLLAN